MKKQLGVVMAMFIVILCSSCNGSDERENNLYGETGNVSYEQKDDLSDYKPMIYVKNSLYAETGNVFDNIPENSDLIGIVRNHVYQNEKIGQEEFTSNVMPLGSEIYLDEMNSGVLYIKFLRESEEKYAEYAIINNE